MNNKSKLTLINYDNIRVLIKNKKLILFNFLLTGILTAIISLCLPVWYRSYTSILPPVADSGLASFSSLISNIPLRALGLGSGVSAESEIVMATLKSRTLMESVANKMNLQERYKTKNIEETIKTLRGRFGFILNDEGTITVFCEDKTPWFSYLNKTKHNEIRRFSKDMTVALLNEMDRINKVLKIARAKNLRLFIEKRYKQNISDLNKAEELLKEYQTQFGVIALPEQIGATITILAELRSNIISKEIELEILKNSVGFSHQKYKSINTEIQELQSKYDEYQLSNNNRDLKNTVVYKKDIIMKMEDLPDLGLKYARLYREVLIQQKIMEFLLPQYEEAKINEAKDTPTIQVLDKAVTPIKKHRPSRAIIVLFYSFLSIIFTTVYIFVKPSFLTFLKNISDNN